MNGPDHFREAERLADRAHHYTYGDGADPVVGAALAAEAQVHATLALVAATAASPEAGKDTREGESTQPAELTIYRASHESIVMGHYTTAAEARKHCETVFRSEHAESTKLELWWREDEDTVDQPEDGVAELFAHVTPRNFDRGRVWNTGYVMTPVEVASAYDEEADE